MGARLGRPDPGTFRGTPAVHPARGSGILGLVARRPPGTFVCQKRCAQHAGKVLGAALNVLAKCPDRCYDQHGLVSGEKVTQLIAAQSIRWFDAEEPPMRTGEMAELIDKWLE
ncbi:MAG: hypothetical protein ACREVJ_08900 [Gammaproteobacteria bacterium]